VLWPWCRGTIFGLDTNSPFLYHRPHDHRPNKDNNHPLGIRSGRVLCGSPRGRSAGAASGHRQPTQRRPHRPWPHAIHATLASRPGVRPRTRPGHRQLIALDIRSPTRYPEHHDRPQLCPTSASLHPHHRLNPLLTLPYTCGTVIFDSNNQPERKSNASTNLRSTHRTR
jgi:hypothetical protein